MNKLIEAFSGIENLPESCNITIEKENSKVQIVYEAPNGSKTRLNMNEDVNSEVIQVKVPSSIFITGVSLINNYDGTKKLSVSVPNNLIISGYGATPRTLNVYQDGILNKYSDSLNLVVEVLSAKDSKIVVNGVGSQLEPPTGNELDLFIIAGGYNAVCSSGTNGSAYDIEVPDGVYEYKPSINNIQKLSNPIGEETSLSKGATWFTSMGKVWKEKTGRNLCILPCGNENATANSYYKDGEDLLKLKSKFDSFKKWYEKQNNFKLGHIMVIWNQGETGSGDGNPINVITKQVFDNLKVEIPEIEQIFYSRISNSDICSNDQTKRYNDLLLTINDDSEYVLVSSNSMKYYWLNHQSNPNNYDQYANNDFGREIGSNIVKYFAIGKLKLNTKPFEVEQGKYKFQEFTGLEILDNKLCRFVDTLTSKNWALLSKLYNSYAKIKPLSLKNGGRFKIGFSCVRGDKEGTSSSPILSGGNSRISVGKNAIEISDGFRTLFLQHGASPFVDRSTNTTKEPIRHNYDIELVGSDLVLKVDGLERDKKVIPDKFSATFDCFGFSEDGTYFEGVISDFNIIAEDGTAPEIKIEPFKYIDKVGGTRLIDPITLNKDLHLVVGPNDDVNSNLFNKKLVLSTDDEWEIQVSCKPTSYGVSSLFTLFGTAKYEQNEIVSVQIGDNQLRLYNVSEATHIDTWEENTGVPFKLGQKHIIKIASDGKGKIYYNCDGSAVYGVNIGTGKHIVNGSKLGDSVIGGVLMDHSGIFYGVRVLKVPTIIGISGCNGENLEKLTELETESIIEKYKGYTDDGTGVWIPETLNKEETESIVDRYKDYTEPMVK